MTPEERYKQLDEEHRKLNKNATLAAVCAGLAITLGIVALALTVFVAICRAFQC